MPERWAARKLAFAEVFSGKQTGAVDEFRRRDLFAPFQFDAEESQMGCAAATDHHSIAPN
jgi:hypothetical protein